MLFAGLDMYKKRIDRRYRNKEKEQTLKESSFRVCFMQRGIRCGAYSYRWYFCFLCIKRSRSGA